MINRFGGLVGDEVKQKKNICTGIVAPLTPSLMKLSLIKNKQTKPTTARTSKLSGIKMEKWENIICIN